MKENELYVSGNTELDILTILKILWSHKTVIIALVLTTSFFAFTKTAFFTQDTYTAYGMLHISNKSEAVNTEGTIQKSDIETSKTLSSTYIEVLKTRIFLQEVSDAIGGNYSTEQIKKMLNISPVNDTELLKVSVTTKSHYDSYLIVNTIMEKAPAKLTSVYKSGEVEIVDPPLPNKKADDRGIAKKTCIGFMLGLILGMIYALLYSVMDKKVHESDEIVKRYNISILGETAQPKNMHSKRKSKKSNILFADEAKKILSEKSDFDTLESYKSIRTNIMFSIPKKETGRVIVVTSASPSEGKTTTTINLAITFAQTNSRVILVDCDLRKSRVHRYLQIERGKGVSNVVCGYSNLDEAINYNIRDNLDCLTAGEIPPNPAELLESVEFSNMISQLQDRYDYIFIDTPPITVVTDAAVLLKECAGAVIVARQEVTTYDLLDIAIDEIRKTNTGILGAIVHDCNEKYKKYGYYRRGKYGSKGGYKYGYGYGDKRKTND